MSAATPTSPAMAATFPSRRAPMVLTASSSAPRPRAMMATSAPEPRTAWRSQADALAAAGDHGRAAGETDFHFLSSQRRGLRTRVYCLKRFTL
jgi:hypothetical protein